MAKNKDLNQEQSVNETVADEVLEQEVVAEPEKTESVEKTETKSAKKAKASQPKTKAELKALKKTEKQKEREKRKKEREEDDNGEPKLSDVFKMLTGTRYLKQGIAPDSNRMC